MLPGVDLGLYSLTAEPRWPRLGPSHTGRSISSAKPIFFDNPRKPPIRQPFVFSWPIPKGRVSVRPWHFSSSRDQAASSARLFPELL